MQDIVAQKVIYHGNCPDGFASALVAFNVFGDKAQYLPAYHNKPHEFTANDEVLYFLDFVYPLPIMQALAAQAKAIYIIDHHKGAEPTYAWLRTQPNCQVIVDYQHSGAVLTHLHFNPDTDVPLLLQYIEDRDCHFDKIPEAKVALLWLDAHPFVFGLWNAFLRFDKVIWDRVEGYNQPMLKKYVSMVLAAAKQGVQLRDGIQGIPAQVTFASEQMAGDVATLMAKKCEGLGIAVVLQANGEMRGSLRGEGYDLIPIAQALGGNGHSYAAAFPLTPELLGKLLA